MRAENGVFPSNCVLGDFYAILSVKNDGFYHTKSSTRGRWSLKPLW